MDKDKKILKRVAELMGQGYPREQANAIANGELTKYQSGSIFSEGYIRDKSFGGANTRFDAATNAVPTPNRDEYTGAVSRDPRYPSNGIERVFLPPSQSAWSQGVQGQFDPNNAFSTPTTTGDQTEGFSAIKNNNFGVGNNDYFKGQTFGASKADYGMSEIPRFNPNVYDGANTAAGDAGEQGVATTAARGAEPYMQFSGERAGLTPLEVPKPTTNFDLGEATSTGAEEQTNKFEANPKIQFFNPYGGGMDIPTSAAYLGASIENKDALGIAAGGVKLAAGLGRNIFGAMGATNRNNEVMADYYQKQRDGMTGLENGGTMHHFQSGGDMAFAGVDEPMIFPQAGTDRENFSPVEPEKRLNPTKEAILRPNLGVPQVVNKTVSDNNTMQRPIMHIQKVDTSGYKDNGNLPPSTYHKVYYTEPNQAKIENQDYEYVRDSGMQVLKGMNNYKIYQERLAKKRNGGLMEFKKGGEMDIAKALTGEYMTGMNQQNPMVEPNAEIEGGEYLQTPEGTQQVIGDKHSAGGEEVNLEEGTKILSDHLKIGGDNARHFRKEYDVDVKASDTYATVLDKFSRKSGLTKLVDEEEGFIKELESQQKDTKDEETLGLNTQYLSNEINETTKKKEPLEGFRDVLFNDAFERQEKSKPKNEKEVEEDGEFQMGGVIKTLASKYGVDEERAKEIAKNFFQGGGMQPYNERDKGDIYSMYNPNNPLFAGTTIDPATGMKVPNSFEDPEGFKHQNEYGTGYFGETVLNNSMAVQGEINRVHPDLTSQFFDQGKIMPRKTLDFQKATNSKYEAILRDASKIYGVDSPKYKQLQKQVDENKFLNDGSVRGLDNKFGNFSSTRPNFELPALPIDVLTEVRNAGANTASQLKSKFPKYYDKYLEGKGYESDFMLGVIEETTGASPKVDATPEVPNPSDVADPSGNKDRMNLMLLPDQTPMSPESLQAHLKLNRRFDRVNPALISPEQNIQELNRSANAAYSQVNNSAGAERIAGLASINANVGENINKTYNSTDTFNAQAVARAEGQNAQIQAAEENARGQDAMSYEQRQLRAKALTDNDVRNYYNRIQENNVKNYNKVNEFNLLNAMYDDFQFDGNTVKNYGAPTKYSFDNGVSSKSNVELLEEYKERVKEDKKEKKKQQKKFGGRFKK